MFLKETRISISYLALMLHQDVRSPSLLQPKNQARLGAIYKKKGGLFKYPKAFQIDNGSQFKGEVTKLLEKHNVDI